MLSPGNALECMECGHFTETNDATEVCESCGRDTVQLVRITPCPEEDPRACTSEYHHWGHGQHVENVDSFEELDEAAG